MPAIDRSLDAVAFVSEHFRDILRRRLRELAGLALITLALLGAIALATWSVQDPSLSHATNAPVRNLLGFPGADLRRSADAAARPRRDRCCCCRKRCWGWRLLTHRPLGDKWRGCCSGSSPRLLAAGFRLALPRIGSWPLPTGLGGVVGDAHAARCRRWSSARRWPAWRC